jgi:uncharacterized protein YndB with AHSA1/START domain
LIACEKETWSLVQRKDLKSFASYLAEEFYDIFPDGQERAKPELLEFLRSAELKEHHLGNFRVTMLNQDAAVVTYFVDARASVQGNEISMNNSVTSGRARSNGKWLNVFAIVRHDLKRNRIRLELNMNDLQLTKIPVAKTGMLVRKPVATVFEAIINPEITTKFWFTKSSDRLELGKRVKWEWEMYDASTEVTVKSIEPNKRILIEWQGYSGPTNVEWRFATLTEGTFVSVTESGWKGRGDELVKYLTDSTQGFSLMLAGLKAFLEYDIQLNLTADRYPKGSEEN